MRLSCIAHIPYRAGVEVEEEDESAILIDVAVVRASVYIRVYYQGLINGP